MSEPSSDRTTHGLALRPFRALRPTVNGARLADLLCPPYDVIDEAERQALLERDPDNAVGVVLPVAPGTGSNADSGDNDPYLSAAARLDDQAQRGLLAVDDTAAVYVYEMRTADGAVTRGLVGAVELRGPEEGIILPHENTMAGPVADRLALMSATEANVEAIYLVYDGGGSASDVVRGVDTQEPVAEATTPDGVRHRLWAITDPRVHDAIDADLSLRKALIADGHHRYATYLELQRRLDGARGSGPWDRGLTLLVDSTDYGPQVHAIHRVLVGFDIDAAVAALGGRAEVRPVEDPASGLAIAAASEGFAAVLTDGDSTVLVTDPAGELTAASRRPGEPAAVADLDVTVVHRTLVQSVWGLPDSVDTVGYAHDVDEAIAAARRSGGTALLLRPTPVAAVTAVAAAGARMPRKSTLFTPKPASGLLMRRFADEA